jgi:hypothetical protein
MCPMATAKGAELLQLQPLGLGLLVLRFAIVLAFALGALHCNDFAHHSSCLVAKAEYREHQEDEESRPFPVFPVSLVFLALSPSYSAFIQ